MNKERIAIIEMLTCAALWSIAGIFIKLVPWNGFAVAGMRSLVAGITIYLCMRLMGIDYVLNRNTLTAGFFSGCTYLCFVTANKLTTAANAIVMQFTSPVFIVIYSVLFFHKKVRKQDAAVVLCTMLGIALFFIDQLAPGYVLGNLVGIASGCSQRPDPDLPGGPALFPCDKARPDPYCPDRHSDSGRVPAGHLLCTVCPVHQILPAPGLQSAGRAGAAAQSRLGLPL